MGAPDSIRSILVLGPTAGGKTQLSIDLANGLSPQGECICCDSMQVYRHMDIGTAKPTPDEQRAAPHHLFDVVEPNEEFNVDTWLRLAEDCMADIDQRGKIPIIVGGTNLYVQTYLQGFMEGPEPDPELRRKLDGLDAGERRAWLERVDPDAAARIHPNDRKRTIRAIEVFESTGTPMSAHQGQWSSGETREQVCIIGLDYAAPDINPRINERVRIMVREGLIEEVRSLWEQKRLGVQAQAALGYQQLIDAFEGRCTEDEAIEQIKIRTRRFAKQQRTWLRRFRGHQPGLWLPAAGRSSQELAGEAIRFAQHWLESES